MDIFTGIGRAGACMAPSCYLLGYYLSEADICHCDTKSFVRVSGSPTNVVPAWGARCLYSVCTTPHRHCVQRDRVLLFSESLWPFDKKADQISTITDWSPPSDLTMPGIIELKCTNEKLKSLQRDLQQDSQWKALPEEKGQWLLPTRWRADRPRYRYVQRV